MQVPKPCRANGRLPNCKHLMTAIVRKRTGGEGAASDPEAYIYKLFCGGPAR